MLILICFGAFQFWVSQVVRSYFMDQQIQQIRTQAERIAVEAAPYLSQHNAEGLYSYLKSEANSLGAALLVVNPSGTVLMDAYSQYNGRRLPYLETQAVLSGQQSFAWGMHTLTASTNKTEASGTGLVSMLQRWLTAGSRGEETVVYGAATIMADNAIAGAVVLSISIQSLMDQIENISLQMSLVSLLVAVVAMLFNILVSGALIKPLRSLTESIRLIGQGDFSHRVKVRGRSEMAEMAATFNAVTEKLENLDQSRGEFVSNASHELKTPLASMKILVETMLHEENLDPAMAHEFLGDINSEIDRMSQLISELLALVKQDEADAIYTQEVHISSLAMEVTLKLGKLASERGIVLETDIARNLYVLGDRMMLEQMITNLVDNAIKYTQEKGHVMVSVHRADTQVQLVVQDNGIGIAQEDITKIFDRFYRVDKARSRHTGGTGLGLSIVKGIVQAHGGSIQVKSQLGEGTSMEVLLPMAPVPSEEAPAQPQESEDLV